MQTAKYLEVKLLKLKDLDSSEKDFLNSQYINQASKNIMKEYFKTSRWPEFKHFFLTFWNDIKNDSEKIRNLNYEIPYWRLYGIKIVFSNLICIAYI